MTTDSTVTLTITLTDTALTDEEREADTQQLFTELSDWDEIESVARVADPNPPEGNKALGSFLIGLLQAKVSLANGLKVLSFLSDRFGNKPMKLSGEANGKKFEIEVHSWEELDALVEAYKKLTDS